MKALTPTQVDDWRRNGFLAPFPLLSEDERRECLAGLARFERWLGSPVNEAEDFNWRSMTHFVLPWVSDLAHDPRILDAVEDLLGPDLLVYTSTFFVKEASSPTIAAWHQDSTYYGLTPAEEVTVWIALTPAGREAGCMEALPFDGAPRQMRHAARVVANSVNRAAQRIVEPVDDARAVPMPLAAGSFSMHHGLCAHRSGPNRTGQRRVGLGLNFIPTSVRPMRSGAAAAMHVRGVDRHGHFELLPSPRGELDEAGRAMHARAIALYHDNYAVEEARHGRASAA